MMAREEKLTEAKLMAVENIIIKVITGDGPYLHDDAYSVAREILQAIRNEEIKQELESHEADLEEASRNKPNEH